MEPLQKLLMGGITSLGVDVMGKHHRKVPPDNGYLFFREYKGTCFWLDFKVTLEPIAEVCCFHVWGN